MISLSALFLDLLVERYWLNVRPAPIWSGVVQSFDVPMLSDLLNQLLGTTDHSCEHSGFGIFRFRGATEARKEALIELDRRTKDDDSSASVLDPDERLHDRDLLVCGQALETARVIERFAKRFLHASIRDATVLEH